MANNKIRHSWVAESENDLPAIAGQLLNNFPEERLFCFYGAMGVGKTTFIKQICKKLDVETTAISPTFSIINEYLTKQGDVVYHFDFTELNPQKTCIRLVLRIIYTAENMVLWNGLKK